MKYLKIFLFLFVVTTQIIYSQNTPKNHHNNYPANHAPISVMADHTHNKNEWMFSYRYMRMVMKNMRQGTIDKSSADVLNSYMVTPTEMFMNMHMIGAMYAPTDKITIALMTSFISNNMNHITRNDTYFNTSNSGISDTKIGTLYRIINKRRHKLHAELGLILPTGSIGNQDITPMSSPNKVILPYPMQNGSGTWNPVLGLTYLLQGDSFTIGFQGRSTFFTGKNSNGYRLGNKFDFNTWLGYNINSWISISSRIQAVNIGKIAGINRQLQPNMVPTANTDNSGGNYVNGGIGFNLLLPKKIFQGLRLGLEYNHPIHQNLNGTQLKTNSSFTIGVQYSL